MRASGRDMQLRRQIGEHLVAAELGRRGFIATPFSGNVPTFDLVAIDGRGNAVPIQVKAIKGPSWQFSADTFLNIEIINDEQIIRGKTALPTPDLLCIFVVLKSAGTDEFYIFHLRDLQDLIGENYKGGRRPVNPQSLHCAVWPKDLAQFRDNWALLESSLNA